MTTAKSQKATTRAGYQLQPVGVADFEALRFRHLPQQQRSREAVLMATFTRELDADIDGAVLDIVVVRDDVETAADTTARVNLADERQDVWHGRTVARFIDCH